MRADQVDGACDEAMHLVILGGIGKPQIIQAVLVVLALPLH